MWPVVLYFSLTSCSRRLFLRQAREQERAPTTCLQKCTSSAPSRRVACHGDACIAVWQVLRVEGAAATHPTPPAMKIKHNTNIRREGGGKNIFIKLLKNNNNNNDKKKAFFSYLLVVQSALKYDFLILYINPKSFFFSVISIVIIIIQWLSVVLEISNCVLCVCTLNIIIFLFNNNMLYCLF